jgi:hypothetical protein
VPTPAALTETQRRLPPRLRRQPNTRPRLRVQMPNEERDLADTAHDLGTALASLTTPILFRRGRIIVYPDLIPETDGLYRIGLIPLDPATARTFFSDHIELWRQKFGANGQTREITVTLSKSEAEGLLTASQFISKLPEITGVHARPLPVLDHSTTAIRLLPLGYDPITRIYTYPST